MNSSGVISSNASSDLFSTSIDLSPIQVAVIGIIDSLSFCSGRYLFPCNHRSPLRCMSDNAINAALRRMGFEKHEITGHGFRAMARTILDEVLQIVSAAIFCIAATPIPDGWGTPTAKEINQDWRKEKPHHFVAVKADFNGDGIGD